MIKKNRPPGKIKMLLLMWCEILSMVCCKLLNHNRILIYDIFLDYYNEIILECAVVVETESS